jgi:hypothetical protein
VNPDPEIQKHASCYGSSVFKSVRKGRNRLIFRQLTENHSSSFSSQVGKNIKVNGWKITCTKIVEMPLPKFTRVGNVTQSNISFGKKERDLPCGKSLHVSKFYNDP